MALLLVHNNPPTAPVYWRILIMLLLGVVFSDIVIIRSARWYVDTFTLLAEMSINPQWPGYACQTLILSISEILLVSLCKCDASAVLSSALVAYCCPRCRWDHQNQQLWYVCVTCIIHDDESYQSCCLWFPVVGLTLGLVEQQTAKLYLFPRKVQYYNWKLKQLKELGNYSMPRENTLKSRGYFEIS